MLSCVVPFSRKRRHSGNSVLCPRSVPSTKRLIRSPANGAGIISRESNPAPRFYTTRVIFDRVQRGLSIGSFRFAPRADIPASGSVYEYTLNQHPVFARPREKPGSRLKQQGDRL